MTVVIHGTQGIDTPDLDITGSGARINGDFSDASQANRVAFQSSVVNGNTGVNVIPNGTSVDAAIAVWNNSGPTDASATRLATSATTSTVDATRNGAGAFLPLAFNAGGAERMRIATNGEVGIGVDPTVGPVTGKLQVHGSITARSTSGEGGQIEILNPSNASAGLIIDVLSTDVGRVFSTRNNFELALGQLAGTGGAINLLTQGLTRQYIDSVGRTFLRTNVSPTSNATGALNILADQGGDGINARHTINGNNFFNIWQTGNTTFNALTFYKGDVQTGVGNISCSTTTTTYATSSDYRLKENVVPMQGALARAMQLRPCIFTWKADGSYGEGFIAHQLQEVVPIAVTGKKDAMLESGEPDYQGVDAAKIVALLTAALQELAHEVDSLRMEVKMLKRAQQ